MSTTTQLVPATGSWVDFGSALHPLPAYQALKSSGIAGVCLDAMTPGIDQDYAYALEAGLQVGWFQGYYAPDFTGGPSAATSRAHQAIDILQKLSVPVGTIVWLDSEEWPVEVTDTECLAWITAWGATVAAAHLQGGAYEGANTPLSGEQWWTTPTIHRYWRSKSVVPTVPNRGYEMIQTADGVALDGITVDRDTVQHDLLGSAPVAIIAVPSTHTVSVPTTPSVPAVTPADLAALDQQVTLLRQDLAAGIASLKAALPTKGTITLS